MRVSIVDYGVGNIAALLNMFEYIGVEAEAVSDHAGISRAEKLVLPGVGTFDRAMENLRSRGLVDPLNEAVQVRKLPVLGICLGMQLMADHSEEGEQPGLGWIEGAVVQLDPGEARLKVPHVGWSDIRPTAATVLFPVTSIPERFYFVHSYHFVCRHAGDVAARVSYGDDICVAVSKDNVHGVQFHPEKSHRFGMRLLTSFAED